VYNTLLDRAQTDKGSRSALVPRVVRLLRTHLPTYVPSADVLARIAAYCQDVAAVAAAVSTLQAVCG